MIAGGLALLGVIALAPPSARGSASSSPGKNAAAASLDGVNLKTFPTVSVQILKGKKKRLLIVTGMFSGYAAAQQSINLGLRVNGIDIEPYDTNNSRIITDFCVGFCTLSGTWWLDLDAAEAAHPGMFNNVPLDVQLRTDSHITDVTGKISVTATMEKK
jgi:hypothetical protein